MHQARAEPRPAAAALATRCRVDRTVVVRRTVCSDANRADRASAISRSARRPTRAARRTVSAVSRTGRSAPARVVRGRCALVGSLARHHASMDSASVCIALANVESRSARRRNAIHGRGGDCVQGEVRLRGCRARWPTRATHDSTRLLRSSCGACAATSRQSSRAGAPRRRRPDQRRQRGATDARRPLRRGLIVLVPRSRDVGAAGSQPGPTIWTLRASADDSMLVRLERTALPRRTSAR
jgi:hypothetical protein